VAREVDAVLAALGFAAIVTAGPVPAPPVRILFIGNSLTVAHALPETVTAMASAVGISCSSRVVAYPDYSLEDHWHRGDAAKAIAEGPWSFVVLQQGPSALPESRVLLRDYTKRFGALAAHAGARIALFMVWPSIGRAFDYDGVHESYRLSAADVAGVFVPAGDAWREVWRRNPRAALYGAARVVRRLGRAIRGPLRSIARGIAGTGARPGGRCACSGVSGQHLARIAGEIGRRSDRVALAHNTLVNPRADRSVRCGGRLAADPPAARGAPPNTP
jgi:hypothetical protein